jgi:hypothetical protein
MVGKTGIEYLSNIVKNGQLKITYPHRHECNDRYEFPIGIFPKSDYDFKWRDECMEKAKKHGIGFVSFSGESHDDVLLWPHYANNYRGLQIKFAADESSFNNSEGIFFKQINYCNDDKLFTENFDLNKWNNESSYRESVIKDALWKKHIRWKYEDEYRLQVQADGGRFKLLEHKGKTYRYTDFIFEDKFGNRFLKFDNALKIEEITLGYNCNKIDDIKRFLDRHNIKYSIISH